MKTKYTNILKTSVVSTIAALMLSSTPVSADCTYELFNISSTKGTKIVDFIDQLSDECEFSVVITDTKAEKILKSSLNKTHIKNLTINEVLDLILKQNNLTYSLENNLLKISYLTTKVFNIDYILSQRKGVGSTDVTLSSSSDSSSGTNSYSSSSSSGGSNGANSGIKIDSTDEVVFWAQLDTELKHVLNRPEDKYVAGDPIINKNAGLITVTATQGQIDRLDRYLQKLQKKVKLQVLIDVQLLTVSMTRSKTTGIDWSQLYKLQNVNVDIAYNTDHLTGDDYVKVTGASISLDQVIKFLKTQGDVNSISNPKVLTLNNQPALVTAGTEYFYKITSSTNQGTSGGSTTTQNDEIRSVFAGILLDITPEISDNDMITLKINPSISETTKDMSTSTSASRTTPPDLTRRQLSSVVTVKDGNRIILGGLIHTSTSTGGNHVPILGDIPILSYLFRREEDSKSIEELVIVIEPHIIRKDKTSLSLSDLGYEGINDKLLNHTITASELDKDTKNDTKITEKAETQDDK
ncbi:pilus (MSHA type) biogenesis protein MshL [bacterium]|nr:pilus (MSHA type) biogenesis protein MshL [bacterium]